MNRYSRYRRRLAAGLVLPLLITLLAGGLGTAPPAEAAVDQLQELGRPNGSNFAGWHMKDKELVRDYYTTLQAGGQPGPLLFKHWMALKGLMTGSAQAAGVIDPDTGLKLYTAHATGVLQALGLALQAREELIGRILRAQLAGTALALPPWEQIYPPLGKGGDGMLFPSDGLQASSSTYVNPQMVVNAIKDLMRNGVPGQAFTGATVFIAPFAFPDAPDGGYVRTSPGVNSFQAVLSSTRAQNHPVGTIDHLFGHYVMVKYFGRNPEVAPSNWKQYLELRGTSPQTPQEWVEEGEWEELTAENWAEDFRIAFGTNQVNYPHRGSFRTPKSRTISAFAELAKAAINENPTTLGFDYVQIGDDKNVAWGAGGIRTNSLVTATRAVTVNGIASMPSGARPRVTVYGRRSIRDRWTPLGGGGKTNQLGQFVIPLSLGPGVWELAVEADADGLFAEELFTVVVVTRQLAGEYWELPELKDMPGHWAEGHVSRLVELGSVSGFGDGTFRPEDPISRGAFLKVMMTALRAEGLIPERFVVMDPPLYEDIAEHWARSYVEEAYANSYFNSTEYFPRFAADDPITREEIGRLVGAAIESIAMEFGETQLLRQFSDTDQIEAWRTPSVAVAVRHGVLKGYPDGTFRPKNTATRAEASVIVIRLLEQVKAMQAEKG